MDWDDFQKHQGECHIERHTPLSTLNHAPGGIHTRVIPSEVEELF